MFVPSFSPLQLSQAFPRHPESVVPQLSSQERWLRAPQTQVTLDGNPGNKTPPPRCQKQTELVRAAKFVASLLTITSPRLFVCRFVYCTIL